MVRLETKSVYWNVTQSVRNVSFGLIGRKLTKNQSLDDFLSFIPHQPLSPAFSLGEGPKFEVCVCCEPLRSSSLNRLRQEGGSGLGKARHLPSVGRRGGWLSSQTWVRLWVQIPALPPISSASEGKCSHLSVPPNPSQGVRVSQVLIKPPVNASLCYFVWRSSAFPFAGILEMLEFP